MENGHENEKEIQTSTLIKVFIDKQFQFSFCDGKFIPYESFYGKKQIAILSLLS